LVAQRRRGSLNAAVESIRLRFLAINFGVLLVLGLGTAMLVISCLRAQTFLRLQMEFVASVSHELRTPLSVIGSAADNLAEGVVRSDQSVREYGSLIRGECRRLSQLVEQTLQFAAGKADYRPRNVKFLRVEDVVNQVLAEASAIIEASGFTVEKYIDPDLPKVRVNMGTFSECFLNLISNALKYGAQSRWIGVHAHPFETGRGTGVRITIEDRGLGIPNEELSQIFEPFYRGRDARVAQIRGTGLGLSLAQEAAATMGARITVESVVGIGSAFTIHMPASYLNSSTIPLEAIVES
jgi:signal transduction histidine kinase